MKTAQERDRDQDLVTIKILFLALRAKKINKFAIPNADFRTCHKQQRKNLVQHVYVYTRTLEEKHKGSRASGVKPSLSPERCDLTNMNNVSTTYCLISLVK